MRRLRLKISESDFNQIQELTLGAMPNEGAAFALAGVHETADAITVLVRRVLAIPAEAYKAQLEYHLEIWPSAINGLISLCEANGLGGVLCHSHGIDVGYSPTDDMGEAKVFDVLRRFAPAGAPTASLLFTPKGVRGRLWPTDGAHPVDLDEVVVVGRTITTFSRLNHGLVETGEVHSRQVLAFGIDGQVKLQQARVAIVGVGGTGSPVAEQIARLGVRDIVLIDPELVDSSNLSRVYGAFPESVGRPKVEVIAEHLEHISPACRVNPIKGSVVLRDVAPALLDRDIIFLCTDEHWGRSFVNQVAYQYLIPTINLGVRITSTKGGIEHGVGIVDVLRPDMPCLWCSQFLSAERIAAESMPKPDRAKLESEGYVQGIDTAAPSVVSSTSAVASLGVSALLQLLTDFMGEKGAIARLNYDLLEGTVRRGRSQVAHPCVCSRVRAKGDLAALPTVSQVPCR